MIRTLNVKKDQHRSVDQSFDVEKFCQVFSNLKHLRCNSGHAKQFLPVFNRLSSPLTLKLDWVDKENPKDDLDRFKYEMEKFDAVYKIESKCVIEHIPCFFSKPAVIDTKYYVEIDV